MSIGRALRRAVTPSKKIGTVLKRAVTPPSEISLERIAKDAETFAKRATTEPEKSYKVGGVDYKTYENYSREMARRAEEQRQARLDRAKAEADAVTEAGGDPRIAEKMVEEAEQAERDRMRAERDRLRSRGSTGNLDRLKRAEQIAEPITGRTSLLTKEQEEAERKKETALQKQKTLEQERLKERSIQSLLDPIRSRRRKAATETAEAMRAGRGRASLMQSQRGGIGFYSRLFNR